VGVRITGVNGATFEVGIRITGEMPNVTPDTVSVQEVVSIVTVEQITDEITISDPIAAEVGVTQAVTEQRIVAAVDTSLPAAESLADSVLVQEAQDTVRILA
jgi:hypothetical protein